LHHDQADQKAARQWGFVRSIALSSLFKKT
jgi:hypothetical protein